MQNAFSKRQLSGILAAVVVLIGMFFLPTSDAFTYAGRNTLGLLIATIIILIFQSMNLGVLACLLIPLMYFLGVCDTAVETLSGYANTTTFFIFASFGITAALVNTNLAKRLMRWIITSFGKTTTAVFFSMMLAAAILSSFMSNLPVCAAFVPLAYQYVLLFPEGEARNRTAKAFLMGIPVASMAGGIITPAGAAINVMVMERLQSTAGLSVSFLGWMFACGPIGLLITIFATVLLIKIFKPANLSKAEIEAYCESLNVERRMSRNEKYVVLVVVLMFVLWIASTWYPYLNTTIVAMSGLFLFMCPGLGVMNFQAFCKEVNWTMFILFGTMTTLASRLSANGVVAWIVNNVGELQLSAVSPVILILAISLFIYACLLIMPIGPSLANQLSVPLIAIAIGAGVDPRVAVIPLVICCVNNYLLPIDVLPLMSYNYGYYTAGEQFRALVWVALAVSVLSALWLPFVFTLGL
ncbi:SLC13 family permease [Intestinimonas butyriciproducens]|uniref:Uncharacterized protein n=1 Tax=Intestinimonas butyriciproducens TaxID=1297617 RepID=A0A0S2W4K8_9FIRM|nr:SLC13 family permease [Intestinimonas butyriciproducens]ALP94270.1 hypothetical protein IB211_01879 [Intestinimonas butyriciproducens]